MKPNDEGQAGAAAENTDFVRTIIRDDLASGKHAEVVTRFPPEPNGFLHIGHAKAVCLDFGLPAEFGGRCHLRFDDTNPETEDPRYVAAIKEDIRWLGFDWGEHEYYASDYFEQLHDWAVFLIEKGVAYVDDLTEEEIREYRGTVTEPGRESPHRDRSVAENIDLFARMRAGEFADGSKVLRARIDMAHANMKMRDPLMYRIRHAHHYRQGDAWCIYPFYDWAHGQSDAIEGITHSLCTLEFDNNRELYDWYVEQLELPAARPHQYEFARLNLDYMITSKRKLLALVEGGHVDGWDDPRMPTLAGMRRRGFTPESIRRLCDLVGVAKADNQVEYSMLEYALRDDLNHKAPRVMCVLDPLKVVITNWPDGQVDELDASYWPHDVPREGSRPLPFDGELWIERDDFLEDPPPKFYRLAPGREVRLRYGYVIRCDEVIKNDTGEIVELRCSYDPDTRGGTTADGRRIQGTIHWVSAAHACTVPVRLFDRLFSVPEPGLEGEIVDDLNPDSRIEVPEAYGEPSLLELEPGAHVQFERLGYFFVDPVDSAVGAPVFHRAVTLRDSWAKAQESATATPARTPATSTPAPAPVLDTGSRSEERDRARAADPVLLERFERFQSAHGLSEEDADILSAARPPAELFESAIAAGAAPAAAANWIVNDILPRLDDAAETMPVDGAALAELIALIDDGTLSSNLARDVLREMLDSGDSAAAIVERRDLRQVSDTDALAALVEEVVAAHPDRAQQYRGGRTGLLGFFMGQVMQKTQGKAQPDLVRSLLETRLAAD